MDMTLAFTDVETTGTDSYRHTPWSVSVIKGSGFAPGVGFEREEKQTWTLQVPKALLANADMEALRISGFYDRYDPEAAVNGETAAREIAEFTANTILAGINPVFDIMFLRHWMKGHLVIPAWHYTPIDVKTLAIGTLMGRKRVPTNEYYPPWPTERVTTLMGLDVDSYERHTSMGDAEMTRDLWLACNGIGV